MPAQNLTQFPNYFTQFVGRDGRISDPWYRSLSLFRTQVADGFTLLPGPGIAVDDTQVSVGDVVTISNTGVISLVGTPGSIDIVNLSLTEQDLQASISTTYPGQTSITTLGTITTVGGISSPPFIQFDTTATEASAAGKMTWDDSSGTISVGLKGGNVNLQLGQEVVMLGYNRTGSTITNGKVVYVLGAHADDLEVGLADNSSFGTSVGTIGVATEDILNNADGFFTALGLVHDLNTAAFAEGDQLWLGTSGGLTNIQPSAPANVVLVGYCVRSHPNQGIIFVKPIVRPKVSDAPDVDVTGLANGQALTWNSSTNLWQPHTLVTGTVTSVAMTVPAFLTVSGSPITSSGTLAVSYSGTPVPVVNGGTGTTTSTGTGSVVLSTSPTLTTPNITGDIQLNNAGYIRSKTSSGTSTRILGLDAANNLYIGSIDAAITGILCNLGGTTYLTIGTTVSTFTTPVVVSTPTGSTHATTKAYVDDLTSFPGWTAPTLTASWVNFGGGYNNVGYYKDSTGRVYLCGVIKSGTIGSAAFTLPVGYRPAAKCLFATISNAALGRLEVDTSGNVIPITGSKVWFSLDNISFQTN